MVRVSQQEKDLSHQRIVAGAARLIRERGVDGAGVAEVMKDAGMTAGGFYRHFANKDELVAAALDAAFAQTLGRLDTHDEHALAVDAVVAFERFYLSATHVNNPGHGCPIPALAGELERSPSLEAPMTSGVERTMERLAAGQSGTPTERRAEAAARLAMMAGAVMMARSTEPTTAEFILESVRNKLEINASPRNESTIDQGDPS